jgi:hypothetical protein
MTGAATRIARRRRHTGRAGQSAGRIAATLAGLAPIGAASAARGVAGTTGAWLSFRREKVPGTAPPTRRCILSDELPTNRYGLTRPAGCLG